jgi:hypothetical protein
LNSSKKKSRTLRFHFSMVEFSTPRYWSVFLSKSPKSIQRILLSRKRSGILLLYLFSDRSTWTPTRASWVALSINSSKLSLKAVLLH